MEKLDLKNVIIEKDIVESFIDELGVKLNTILEKNMDIISGEFNENLEGEIKRITIKKALILEKKR